VYCEVANANTGPVQIRNHNRRYVAQRIHGERPCSSGGMSSPESACFAPECRRNWGRRATPLGFRLQCSRRRRRASGEARVDGADPQVAADLNNHYALARKKRFGKLRFFARSWLILISPLVDIPVVLLSGKIKSFDHRLKAISVLVRLRAWRFVESNRILLKAALVEIRSDRRKSQSTCWAPPFKI
jgi:hypothetical protein